MEVGANSSGLLDIFLDLERRRSRKEVEVDLPNYAAFPLSLQNLQEYLNWPGLRRNIICEDTLRNLFAVDTIDMFQMNKALAKHIWPLDSDGDEPNKKEKRPRGGNSAFLAPLKLSDALVKFLGAGESELPRSDVVKRIWDYIKLNNLQDPADKRQILCDEKLKELFKVDTIMDFQWRNS